MSPADFILMRSRVTNCGNPCRVHKPIPAGVLGLNIAPFPLQIVDGPSLALRSLCPASCFVNLYRCQGYL